MRFLSSPRFEIRFSEISLSVYTERPRSLNESSSRGALNIYEVYLVGMGGERTVGLGRGITKSKFIGAAAISGEHWN